MKIAEGEQEQCMLVGWGCEDDTSSIHNCSASEETTGRQDSIKATPQDNTHLRLPGGGVSHTF